MFIIFKHQTNTKIAYIPAEMPYLSLSRGISVYVLKECWDVLFFQFSDESKAIERICCRSANRLCNNHIYFSSVAIFNHMVEIFTLFGVSI